MKKILLISTLFILASCGGSSGGGGGSSSTASSRTEDSVLTKIHDINTTEPVKSIKFWSDDSADVVNFDDTTDSYSNVVQSEQAENTNDLESMCSNWQVTDTQDSKKYELIFQDTNTAYVNAYSFEGTCNGVSVKCAAFLVYTDSGRTSLDSGYVFEMTSNGCQAIETNVKSFVNNMFP